MSTCRLIRHINNLWPFHLWAASQQGGIARQLIFPLWPLSERIQLGVQPAAGDGPRERREKKRGNGREDQDFITVNANERIPLYNSSSLSALMSERRSGESACVQYEYVTEIYVDPSRYSQTKVKATVIICSEKAGLLMSNTGDLLYGRT